MMLRESLVLVLSMAELGGCSSDSQGRNADGGSSAGGAATGGQSSGGSGGNAGHAGGSGGNAGHAGGSGGNAGHAGGSGGNAGHAGGAQGSGGNPVTDSGTDGQDGSSSMVTGDAGICASCGSGHVCVEHRIEGGGLVFPNDAGVCPDGTVLNPDSPHNCERTPTYECARLPGACSNPPGTPAPAHCTCAASLCGSFEQCTDVSPTLMQCALLAP